MPKPKISASKAFSKTKTPAPEFPNPGSQPGSGLTLGQIVRKSNMWRDNYNPLRGLSIGRLMTIFEAAERGAYAELQLTLRKVEKRYPVLKGFIERLLSTIEELEWDVKIVAKLPPGATQAMAEAQRDYLKSRYDLITNLTDAVGQIALADIRGYAVLQKHRYEGGENDGAVQELYWLEPWCWARDGYYGDFFYNEISRFGVGLGSCMSTFGEANRIGSVDLPREDFIIREVNSPLYEIALIAFVNWIMGRRDYAAFTEIFGLPNGVVIMPPQITPGMENDYLVAAQKVAEGVSGALPNGSEIKFPTAAVRGESPFESFCKAQDEDVVMAATSGILSMLNGHTGLGKGPTDAHDDAWQRIALMKAKRVNETMQKDFDAQELAAKFPGQPVCVYFELAAKDEENVGELADTVLKFSQAGLKSDAAEISERSGLKLEPAPTLEPGEDDDEDPEDPSEDPDPEDDEDIKGNAKVKNRELENPFVTAVATDLQPLADRLAKILAIADPDLRAKKLSDLADSLDSFQKDLLADPSATAAVEQILGKALIAGMQNQRDVGSNNKK